MDADGGRLNASYTICTLYNLQATDMFSLTGNVRTREQGMKTRATMGGGGVEYPSVVRFFFRVKNGNAQSRCIRST